jgi:hypothetical protein
MKRFLTGNVQKLKFFHTNAAEMSRGQIFHLFEIVFFETINIRSNIAQLSALKIVSNTPGPNPTTSIYNVSAVNFYNSTGSLAHL